jgi:hypothetical protein
MRLNDKINSALSILRVLKQRLHPRDTLLAGPYSGELGLELMEWSGYVRRLSTRYKRTVAVSYAGHSCLYDGCEYHPHDLALEGSGYWYGSLTLQQAENMVSSYAPSLGLSSFDWIHPLHLNRYTKQMLGPQLLWPPFDRSLNNYQYDVAFHFRSLRRAEDLDTKNYPPEYADALVNRCKAEGIRVCCIGHPKYALASASCDDRRSSNLSASRDVLADAKIVAGGSSSPMHLASLCGLPIVVWWKAALFRADVCNTYLRAWNPHRVPVFIVSESDFQPSPDEVFSQIVAALDSIGQQKSSHSQHKIPVTLMNRP